MVYIDAPAKINLHLDIKNRRPDSYHDLASIFQSVSLFDTLLVRSLKTKKECRIRGRFDFPEKENILYKAYREFTEITGITEGIEVRIEKRIPMGAGLGGGSSDAAALIKCLEALFERMLSKSESVACASRLGSDVAFFLSASACFVAGRGEQVTPIHPRTDYGIVIVYPGFGVPTKAAYDMLDTERMRSGYEYESRPVEDVIASYEKDRVADWKFDNSFSRILKPRYPILDRIIRKLHESGACYANITGSGSCVFGVFDTAGEVPALLPALKKLYRSVFYVKPLDKNPLPVLQ